MNETLFRFITAHAPAMTRPDLGRRRRIGPILTKGFSSGNNYGMRRLNKSPTNFSLSLVSATRLLSTRPDKRSVHLHLSQGLKVPAY
jgi:hypothetical protein